MTRFDRLVSGALVALIAILGIVIAVSRPATRNEVPSQPMLLYLVAATQATEVWQLTWETLEGELIAQLSGQVLERAVLPTGATVIYPVERSDGGHDLWQVDIANRRAQRWIACAPDDCPSVASSPDGLGIVYTRITEGEPALWWAQIASTQTTPLFENETSPGQYPAWSPDGTRLAYVDPAGQVCVVAVDSVADTLCISARMGIAPVWSPNGTKLLITDMQLETAYANHILEVDVTSGQFLDISDAFSVEDDAPTWSPDGEWIAFRRRAAGTAMGMQLWLMRADGSDARAITTDTNIHYGPPIWMADGTTLLAARYTSEEHGIWALSSESGAATLVAAEGYLPHMVNAGGRADNQP